MRGSEKVVKKKTIYLFFAAVVLFAILEPTAFIGTWVHSFCGYIRSASFFCCVVVYLLDRQYQEVEGNIILLFLVVLGITTFSYQGSLTADYSYLFRCTFTGIVVLQYFMKRDPTRICKTMGIMLSVFLLLDAMTFILPGLDLGYVTDEVIKCFIGSKTTITYYMIPALAFDYTYLSICPKKDKWKAKFWLVLAIGSTIAYLMQIFISTAAVCLVLMVGAMFVVSRSKMISEVIVENGFWVSTVLIVLLIAGTSVGFVNYFVTAVLGESGDFNGRTQIWQMAFIKIINRPFLGYGLGTKVYLAVWQPTNVSAHNLFAGILLRSGILGMAAYSLIIFMCYKTNQKHKKYYLQGFMLMTLVVMNIMGFSEEFIGYPIIYFLYLLIADSHECLEKRQEYAVYGAIK